MSTTSIEDTWTDVADPVVRRLVQNRLNQRALRQRKLQEEVAAGITRRRRGRPKTRVATPLEKKPIIVEPALPENQPSQVGNAHSQAPSATLKCHDIEAAISKLVDDLSLVIFDRLSHGDPSADLLIHLTTLNSLRAIMFNMDVMGWPIKEMSDERSISHFNSLESGQTASGWHCLPLSLRPTPQQLAVIHHPWIDVLPFPSLRDMLIAQGHQMRDGGFCHDALGLHAHLPAGLLTWGSPWDPCGWEMSDSFAERWHCILYNCQELVASTNYWRTCRGDPGLLTSQVRLSSSCVGGTTI